MINKIIIILAFITTSYAITLQEAFDNASNYGEYEKYLILEPNSIYTGGLGIYEGDVYINCQGSVVDLQEGNGIWVYGDVEYPSSLHMEYCTVTNGSYYGLSFGGLAVGNIVNGAEYNCSVDLNEDSSVDILDIIIMVEAVLNNNSL